jgi:predicted nucleic acid-binding protein
MPGIIISDTSCLILLEKLGKLELLKTVFGKLTITQIVADEFEKAIPEFIEIENPLLIIDDYKARREAKQLRIKYTGTLGILIVAKEKGLIDSVTEILDDIKKTDFRISERLVNEIILKSGE